MNRGFALTIGFLAMLAPAMARAQTNLDQGKSASQLFANGCAECHKAPHALAKGKSAGTVAEFLREHYTTGPQQAAALAAYLVSGRDMVASPVPGRRPPGGAASQRQPKSEERATANARPRRPSEETTGGSMMNPVVRSEPGSRESKPTTATRNRRKEPATADVPEEPAAIAHAPPDVTPEAARPEPAAQEAPTSAVAPAAAAPTAAVPAPAEPVRAERPAAQSGETTPRDNIPD